MDLWEKTAVKHDEKSSKKGANKINKRFTNEQFSRKLQMRFNQPYLQDIFTVDAYDDGDSKITMKCMPNAHP